MAKPTEKYIISGGNVIPIYDLGGGYCVMSSDVYDLSNFTVYENKMDALYDKLIIELQNGKPLENYRSSKYYKQYIERLKKDNPEYII